MQAIVNAAYRNRVQLELGVLTGPFVSTLLGAFDPRRDLEVYIGGIPAILVTFRFDSLNNQYLMFANQVFDPNTALVQVIHHIPAPAFTAGAALVPGFALIASLSTIADAVIPSVMLRAPAVIVQNQPVAFIWSAVGVTQIRITTTTGYDSGLLAALSSAGVVYTNGFSSSGSYSATITAYNAGGVAGLTDTIAFTVNAAV